MIKGFGIGYSTDCACQEALGGFEDIIGDEFRDIERSLLEGLTPEQENELLDRRAQAIANKKKEHDKLEEMLQA